MLAWLRNRAVPGALKGFHGDRYLVALVDSILSRCNWFVETGTHVGTTLAYVARAQRHLKCLSCEPNEELRHIAEKATARFANVTISPLTSQDFLKLLEREYPDLPRQRVFFWLDAHGYGYQWPLLGEVAYVTSRFPSAYMLIDDVRVPGRPEFGYDEYDGQVCDFEYIKGSIEPGTKYRRYYPAYTEHTSTYHPLRGWQLFDIGHEAPLALPRGLEDKYQRVD